MEKELTDRQKVLTTKIEIIVEYKNRRANKKPAPISPDAEKRRKDILSRASKKTDRIKNFQDLKRLKLFQRVKQPQRGKSTPKK